MELPDPVPLGVSGTLTVPRACYAAAAARDGPVDILADEPARIAYVAQRLDHAFGRPLTLPGSDALGRAMLELFPDPEPVLTTFAEKALETLRDGDPHDRMAFPLDGPPAAIWFRSWNGTHWEVQPLRYGAYLKDLVGSAFRIIELCGPLAGFLQIDVFVREKVDPEDPVRLLAKMLEIDVEFSFLPGLLLRYSQEWPSPLPNMFLVTRSLCSAEKLRALDAIAADGASRYCFRRSRIRAHERLRGRAARTPARRRRDRRLRFPLSRRWQLRDSALPRRTDPLARLGAPHGHGRGIRIGIASCPSKM